MKPPEVGLLTQMYLASGEIIDWQNPAVHTKAAELASVGAAGDAGDQREHIARRCFEFVRDEIRHSMDARENPVTCRASDALKYRTGFCYAKSHLLAALLRANGIPAGLCYQRLRLDGGGYCLHGLNALYLEQYGWYRVDPRGNIDEIASEFRPPRENLAFSVSAADGEADLAGIWPEPLPVVVEALAAADSFHALAENLPDIRPEELEAGTSSRRYS